MEQWLQPESKKSLIWRISLRVLYKTENSFYKCMIDVGDVGTSTAMPQSKPPRSRVSKVRSLDKEPYRWERTLPKSFNCSLLEAPYCTIKEHLAPEGP